MDGEDYKVSTEGLSFSVMLFLITSISCLGILILRRIFLGGELGGKSGFVKWTTAGMCVFLWFIYVLLSCLDIYGHI
jgi:magnesium/proton exchanger